MEVTPNDLRQQHFEIKFRGYNADDVEVFRDLAANALEESRAEVLKLTEENKHVKSRLEHLLSMEETLKAALLEAQRNAERTIASAKQEAETTISSARREADLIMKEAQVRRDEIVADMHRQLGKLVSDINKIRFIRQNNLSKLKNLLATQLEMVEQAIAEDKEFDEATHQPPVEATQPELNLKSPEEKVTEGQ